jgi:pyruvate dehydrogenase E2 component (dihydrolipoamide acetyltransferase)
MGFEIVMPQLGLTMEEGTVSGWLKKTGDVVKKNDLIFSVSTDKVEMDVESSVEGIFGEIIVPAGETVKVGTVLAYVNSGEGEDISAVGSEQPASEVLEKGAVPEQAAASPQQTTVEAARGNRPASRARVSPRARKLAKELGVDLAAVRGSGTNGELTENDIRDASTAQPVRNTSSPDATYRQLVAERLTRSIQTIPTFSVAAEVNAEHLIALHESFKKSMAAKVTITDLLLIVFAETLKSNPDLNAVWEKQSVSRRTLVDLALAVATPKGVVAPVLRDLGSAELSMLVARRIDLVERARAGRLALDELEGGVATLSNLGTYRIDHFQAIIPPGQTSILAVGQIRKRPWVDGALTVKPTIMLNLTVDHRVCDGVTGAAFLSRMAELIENPQGFSPSSVGAESRGSNG